MCVWGEGFDPQDAPAPKAKGKAKAKAEAEPKAPAKEAEADTVKEAEAKAEAKPDVPQAICWVLLQTENRILTRAPFVCRWQMSPPRIALHSWRTRTLCVQSKHPPAPRVGVALVSSSSPEWVELLTKKSSSWLMEACPGG